MPAIIEYPTIVQQAVTELAHLFQNEPARRHFAEYLTGLLVAERKTVSGINSECAVTTDQSCLNRWITEVGWDHHQLNEHRLAVLQRDPSTRYSQQGVIPFDNVLIGHDGECIEDVGYFWDHAERRHLIAHDCLIINYVRTSGTHDPLASRRFRKREDCQAWHDHLSAQAGGLAAATPEQQAKATFKSHTALVRELVGWVIERHIPGDFTGDSYFTNAPVLNFINQHGRGYVGDLQFNRKIVFQGKQMSAAELASQITAESRKVVAVGDEKQWYFSKTIRLPEIDQPVRVVILWERKNGVEAKKMVVTNRTYWEVTRILRVYRRRSLRDGDFSSRRQAASGDGRVSVEERRGSDQTHVSRLLGAHFVDLSDAAGPCA